MSILPVASFVNPYNSFAIIQNHAKIFRSLSVFQYFSLKMISLVLKAYEAQKDQSENSDTDFDQWENEVKSKVKPRVLDAIKYYGTGRGESTAKNLVKNHIVITTYNTVVWDKKNNETVRIYFIKNVNSIVLTSSYF